MEPRLQLRVQRYGWDKAAGFYEQYWQKQLAGAQRNLLAAVAAQPGESVLDVACGTGLVTFPLADHVGVRGTVVGIDLSRKMVDIAKESVNTNGHANITFERMNAEKLDLPENLFDLAVCSLGLMYIPDPRQALREMHRVLKPGGRLAVLVWGQRRNCGWAEIFPIVDARVKSEVCPLFFQLGGRGVLEKALEDLDFTDIHVENFHQTLSFANDEEACLAAFAGGPVALAYKRFNEETRKAVHMDYLRSIENYRRGEAYEIPGEFLIATAWKS